MDSFIFVRLLALMLPFDISPKGTFVQRKLTSKAAMQQLASKKVKFVDLQLTDIPGRLRHVTMPTEMMSEELFREGVAKLDGSSVKGFVEIFESDMLLVPDPSTFGVIPWGEPEYLTARFICDVNVGQGKGRFQKDPRFISQKAEKLISDMGFTSSLWGPEVEFFVFSSATWETHNPFSSGFKLSSPESAMETRGTNFPVRFKDGYYPAPPVDTLNEYRNECVTALRDGFGILSNAHHHEVATSGQCEIDMYRDSLVAMADAVMTYKLVTKNVASKRGLIASTMPKPIFGDNAVGMHVHSSLWKGARNAFYDPDDDYAEVSQTCRYYIGGLLDHSRALTAITNPTTNSYRRLVPGYEAPVFVAWSKSNRSANVRIPVYEKKTEGAKRVEFRTPDPSCNPYLAFSAIAAAGLDGIRRKLDPGDPVNEDIYKLTPEKRKSLRIKELPGSLLESTESLRSDSKFLHGLFPDELLDTIIELELENFRAVSARPHPYEFHLYFDL
jgi:glutamine synthetase